MSEHLEPEGTPSPPQDLDHEFPPMRPRRETSRLTVQEVVYHQLPGGKATAVGRPFQRELSSEDDHPFVRSLTVGPEWSELPVGWCLDLDSDPPRLPSHIHVSNDVGTAARQVSPSQDERKSEASRIVEVAFSPSGEDSPRRFAILRPGTSLRMEPASSAYPLLVRCLTGPARITVSAFPN